jgi:hypothetical protein
VKRQTTTKATTKIPVRFIFVSLNKNDQATNLATHPVTDKDLLGFYFFLGKSADIEKIVAINKTISKKYTKEYPVVGTISPSGSQLLAPIATTISLITPPNPMATPAAVA